MKKRILSCFLALAMALSLLPMSVLAAGADSQIRTVRTNSDDLSITKSVSGIGTTENPYKLTMEAYVSGTVGADTSVPLDIVLVLDVSGSMDERFSTETGEVYERYYGYSNSYFYSDQDNLWYQLDDGTYVEVAVARDSNFYIYQNFRLDEPRLLLRKR